MPNVCKYYIKAKSGSIEKYDVCFARPLDHFYHKRATAFEIIIPKKWYYKESKEKTLEYLNDLLDMGFRHRIKIRKNEIRIKPLFTLAKTTKMVFYCQIVRYLYENDLPKFLDKYFQLKDMNLPYTKLELLYLTHSVLEIDGTTYAFNVGHYPIQYRCICPITKVNSLARSTQTCHSTFNFKNYDRKELREIEDTKELIAKLYELTK